MTPPDRASAVDETGDKTDFRSLYAEGLRQVQALAGSVWTDYNDHDPGVTILQQACYALSEVAYRIDWPIADLIAEPSAHTGRQALFPGPDILTCGPVTPEDSRKLAYAAVHNLRNIWIEEAGTDLPCGLFRVFVEPYDYDFNPTAPKSADPRAALKAVLAAHRPFTEDLHEIVLLRPVDIVIDADLTIDTRASADDIVANIIATLRDELVPAPHVRTIAGLYAEGLSLDRIFDGPSLGIGTIDNQCERPNHIAIADIEQIVSRQIGVISIDRITILVDGTSLDPEHGLINLAPDMSPAINADKSIGAVTLTRAGVVQKLDLAKIKTTIGYIETIRARRKNGGAGPAAKESCGDLPIGSHPSGLSFYMPIETHFPVIYGIGMQGVSPDEATDASRPISLDQRAIKAARLKAYLSGFDQLLADLLAQLDHLPDLFAVDRDENAPTYFAGSIGTSAESLARVEAVIAANDQRRWRREAMLDHLLARFNEHFDDAAWDRHTDLSKGPDTKTGHDHRLRAKADFLARMVELSSRRGMGADMSSAHSEASAIVRRIELKTGVVGIIAIEHLLLRPSDGAMLADPSRSFYEHRASFLVPEVTALIDHGLRDFIGRVVLENCPAHVESRCFWIDRDDMTAIADIHSVWLTARARAFADPSDRAVADQGAAPLRNLLARFWGQTSPEVEDDGE